VYLSSTLSGCLYWYSTRQIQCIYHQLYLAVSIDILPDRFTVFIINFIWLSLFIFYHTDSVYLSSTLSGCLYLYSTRQIHCIYHQLYLAVYLYSTWQIHCIYLAI